MAKNWFSSQVSVNASLERSFQWYRNPGTFQRLIPPWAPISLFSDNIRIHENATTESQIAFLGSKYPWKKKFLDVRENRNFSELQVKGPFHFWHNQQSFSPNIYSQDTTISNQVDFELPFGNLGEKLLLNRFRKNLEAYFQYRDEVLKRDLPLFDKRLPIKRILITGSRGFLGKHLKHFLLSQGHQVNTLTHDFSGKTKGKKTWSYISSSISHDLMENYDVIIHLASENLSNAYWSPEKKCEIYQSRVLGTRLIAKTISELSSPPKLFLCASSTSYYGNTSHLVSEDANPGSDFLSKVNVERELACKPAEEKGIRTVKLRFGNILSYDSSFLKRLIPIFKMGLGAKIASGHQMISWVSLDDALHALAHIINHEDLTGPVNITSPQLIPQRDFASILAKVLKRPLIFQVPKVLIKSILREKGENLLLNNQEVLSLKLKQSGFVLKHNELERVLSLYLGIPYIKR